MNGLSDLLAFAILAGIVLQRSALLSLFRLVSRLWRVPQFRTCRWLLPSVAIVTLAANMAHAIQIGNLWWSAYSLMATVKIAVAAAAIPLNGKPAARTATAVKNGTGLTPEESERQARDAANYRAQMEAINRSNMMCEFAMDGIILSVNDRYLRAFGMIAEEVVGQHDSIFVTPEYARSDEYLGLWARLREGLHYSGEFARVGKNGRTVWLEASYNPILDADGVPTRVIKFASDVSERVAQQAALRNANARAALALEKGRIGIWSWDLVTDQITWDPLVRQLYGVSPKSDDCLTFEQWMAMIHADDREANRLALRQCADRGRPYDHNFRVAWADGTIHHICAAGDVERDAENHAVRIVGATWDTSELALALEVANESNRAKSEFLANMSHEIRTPMNAIMGMTYLALRYQLNVKQKAYLQKIDTAAQSLLSIMNDILDYSKIEAGKLDLECIAFSLSDVFARLADIVENNALAKGLRLTFDGADESKIRLIGDPLRLGQILINLVNNAIKFTEMGEIVVSVRMESLSDERVRLNISVRDTGIGMSPDQIANLFQSFRQADSSFTRRFGGTGLGLAISKQLVELMGGEISAESELGHGSTFRFSTNFDVAAPVAAERTHSGKISVLVVEDDDSLRELMMEMLRTSGFSVRGVTSGEEALAAVLRHAKRGKHFDLVLMDWQLPGMDGMETARSLKYMRTIPEAPAVVLVSSFEKDDLLAGSAILDVDGFLGKPVDQESLTAAIASALEWKWEKSQLLPPPPESPETSDLVGRRVLLVEDNEINRDLATELLEDLGLDVDLAVNGREGVDRIMADSYDLVLMDIQMPLMDGLTATRLIRSERQFRNLPILAMTAHAMSGDRERSLEAGMDDHLTKPISADALRKMLVRWMPRTRQNAEADLVETTVAALSPTSIPETLPPFDIQAALRRANGKPKLLRKMMSRFCSQYVHATEDLHGLIAEGKMEDARRLAHSLRGVAATLEANDLSEAAGAVERALHEKQMRDIEAQLQSIELALRPAIEAGALLELMSEPADADPGALAPV